MQIGHLHFHSTTVTPELSQERILKESLTLLHRWKDHCIAAQVGVSPDSFVMEVCHHPYSMPRVFARQQGSMQRMTWEADKMIHHLVLLWKSLVSNWRWQHTHKINMQGEISSQSITNQVYQRKAEKRSALWDEGLKDAVMKKMTFAGP